jgi:hypothetical protein
METKILFLKNEFLGLVAGIEPERKPLWGKMSVQHMTEHMAREGFGWATGNVSLALQTAPEHIEKMQAFIMSDKPFKENTPNKLMGEELPELEFPHQDAARKYLENSITKFFETFENNPDKKVLNPFFGMLDFKLSVYLLYKHALHHLRQFAVEIK